MIEGVDYFPIVDSRVPARNFDVCRMEAEKIDEIGKDFHLY